MHTPLQMALKNAQTNQIELKLETPIGQLICNFLNIFIKNVSIFSPFDPFSFLAIYLISPNPPVRYKTIPESTHL